MPGVDELAQLLHADAQRARGLTGGEDGWKAFKVGGGEPPPTGKSGTDASLANGPIQPRQWRVYAPDRGTSEATNPIGRQPIAVLAVEDRAVI